jgi:hypothetical protein
MRFAECHPDRKHAAKGLCKPCYMAQYRRGYVRLPEVARRRKESSWAIRGISMTLEQFATLFQAQDGRCAVCGAVDKRLVVDHDHNTGKVRGLLCDYCNRRLMIPRNTVKILRRAAAYLESSQVLFAEKGSPHSGQTQGQQHTTHHRQHEFKHSAGYPK